MDLDGAEQYSASVCGCFSERPKVPGQQYKLIQPSQIGKCLLQTAKTVLNFFLFLVDTHSLADAFLLACGKNFAYRVKKAKMSFTAFLYGETRLISRCAAFFPY